MQLHTTSEVISLAITQENESAKFYESLSLICLGQGEVFLSMAKENGKNIIQTQRTYYEVISDAIEGCFAFNLETDDYEIDTTFKENMTYQDALRQAIDFEERIIKFYSEAAAQSDSLMADIPRVFKMMVRKRNDRQSKLQQMLDKEG